MKLITGYVAMLAVQLLLVHAAIADETSLEQSALDFQSSRFKAMVDADIDTLEVFLADELTYSHTTGWAETKSDFLQTADFWHSNRSRCPTSQSCSIRNLVILKRSYWFLNSIQAGNPADS